MDNLTIYDEKGGVLAQYPEKILKVIKKTVAKKATDEELYMFLRIAAQYNLNPFMKEIWFAKMGESEDADVAIMTSRDGFRKLAMRDPTFIKCQSVAVYENDEFEMEWIMGEIMNIHHKFSHKDRGVIKGAYAVLKTTTHEKYATYVDFREYDQRNRVWKKYPSSMIRKVAENDVYKRFVNINGLNDYESMPTQFKEDINPEDYEELEPIEITKINIEEEEEE